LTSEAWDALLVRRSHLKSYNTANCSSANLAGYQMKSADEKRGAPLNVISVKLHPVNCLKNPQLNLTR
jgi:hypothetical protein